MDPRGDRGGASGDRVSLTGPRAGGGRYRPGREFGEDADETGIIVAGKDALGRGYVLADLSGHYPPTEWAKTAIAAYRAHGADRIVAEVNNGGEMVEATLRVI